MKPIVVTRKGQVTIPLNLRKKYKLSRGTLVIFKDVEDGILIKPLPRLEDQAGVDKGKYDVKKLKNELDMLRREWR